MRRRGGGRLLIGAGLAGGMVVGAGGVAEAATIEVTSLADDGGGGATTLREAISLANNTTVADEITFRSDLTGQVLLTGAGDELDVTEPVTISGPGADIVTVNGLDDQQIFHIDIDDSTVDKDVTISGLTLADGEADNDDGLGGKDNGSGAAIKNVDADLTLNEAFVTGSTTVTPSNGVIASAAGTHLRIRRSTISGNSGVRAIGTQGYLELTSSTVSYNDTTYGVALGTADSSAVVLDSTISGNTGNREGLSVAGEAYVQNTIIANHSFYDVGTAGGGQLTVTLSLIEDAYLGPESTLNVTGVDPQLGALQDNGGPTPTQLPAASSPVVDRGFSRLATDQRGSSRVVNFPFLADVPNEVFPEATGADIGAVELTQAEGPTAPAAPAAPVPPGTAGPKRKKCKKAKRKKKRALPAASAAAKKCKPKKRKKR